MIDLSQISTFCFTASYAVALSLETASLVRRFGWHRVPLIGIAVAGVFAHAAYLVLQSRATESLGAAALSSPADWCLMASLALAVLYLAATFWWPKWATGLFLLPLVLGLIFAARFASQEPLGAESASAVWGRTHAVLLVLATVTVCVGFLAGLMYLIQSWRLKHKLPPSRTFRLPSLEWLERINARSLGVSALLVGGGFVSGLVLTRLRANEAPASDATPLWTDPVVISLAGMLAWLLAAEVFRLVYPAARRGRKVAYLTLASFVFLVITIASMALNKGQLHGGGGEPQASLPRVESASGVAVRGRTNVAFAVRDNCLVCVDVVRVHVDSVQQAARSSTPGADANGLPYVSPVSSS